MRGSPLILLLALTGCGSTLYSTSNTVVPAAAPDDLYACVQTQLTKMGYRRTQFDAVDRWFLAERPDAEGQVSAGNFRRTMFVQDAKVHPDASGGSGLTIVTHTFNEFATQRGFNREEIPASTRAKLDAQTVQQACAPAPAT
jgi:hypothetical protein